MKNNLLKTIIILLAVTFVTLQSCEKKEMINTENGTIENHVVSTDKIATLLTSNDINWILSNEDKEDMEVNKNLYYLGIALTEIVSEKVYIADIEAGVKKSQLNSITFDDFISQKSNVEAIINDKLNQTDLSALTSNKGKLEYGTISNSFHYKGIEYRPVIHVANTKIADFSLSPIVSPGIEVKDNKEKGIENAIIAWRLSNNEWEEFLLMEDDAMNMKNPVMIISLSTDKDIEIDKRGDFVIEDDETEIIDNPINNKGLIPLAFNTGNFRIDYRYEGSGDSEFTIKSIVERNNVITVKSRYEVASVDKNDIGDDLSSYMTFLPNDIFNPYEVSLLNTYERDWYSGGQSLGYLTYSNGTKKYFEGKRKYYNEWYAFDPGTHNDNTTFYFWTQKQSLKRTSKGYIWIHSI